MFWCNIYYNNHQWLVLQLCRLYVQGRLLQHSQHTFGSSCSKRWTIWLCTLKLCCTHAFSTEDFKCRVCLLSTDRVLYSWLPLASSYSLPSNIITGSWMTSSMRWISACAPLLKHRCGRNHITTQFSNQFITLEITLQFVLTILWNI